MLAQRLILVETEQHDTQAVLTHHHARDGGFLLDLDQRCKIGHIAQVRFRGNGVAFGIVLARAVLGLLITGFLGITVLALAMVRFAFAGFRGAVVLARAMVGGRLLSGRSVPSGLMCEDNTYNIRQNMIRADVTLSIQLPKLSFLFPENEDIVGEWQLLDIQLKKDFIDTAQSPYYITEEEEIRSLIKPRKRFAHKGTFGHALLIAGSYGMAGASILSARACLRSGVGLLTVHVPIHNHDLLQTTVPEAIVQTDIHDHYFAEPVDTDRYQAIAIGPGLGQEEDTALAMMEQIQGCPVPLVLDADAINIFGTHRNWLSRMPKRCILTPHLKELERLIGKCMDTYERLTKTKELAAYLQSYIIIKGSWSTVVTPEGNCYFNPTGNPGMATAGSGDVLTGILAALLAQGYTQEDACRLGVYVHGLAGDIAAEEKGEIGTTSSDLIDALPAAWKKLTETKGRFTKE